MYDEFDYDSLDILDEKLNMFESRMKVLEIELNKINRELSPGLGAEE